MFGFRCIMSPNVNMGILFLFSFLVTRRTDWGSGGGVTFSLLLDLSQSSLVQLGGSLQATAGTMGDGREMGKLLGQAVTGVSGSSKGGRVGEVAQEIRRVGRAGEGGQGAGVGTVKVGG